MVLAGLFMLTVLIACIAKPERDGKKDPIAWSTRLQALKDLLPPLVIFSIVIGSIYLDWPTPTDSAAPGVVRDCVDGPY